MTTEIKKAILPRIVADRIEELRGCFERNNEYIADLWMRTGGGVPAATNDLRQVTFDTLMVALVVGYDREMTEEERMHDAIIREWKLCDGSRCSSEYSDGFADGIVFVLGKTGVEITGVNA